MKSGESITAQSIDEIGRYPVYGGNGLRGFTDAYTHDGTFILIGRQGALCGNVHLVHGSFWASEHAVVTTVRGANDPEWLSYLLTTMNLNQYSESAAQPGISVEKIENLKIPFPNPDQQHTIATILNAAERGIKRLIRNKRRLIRLLREQKQAIINQAVTRGIDPNVPLKPSGVPWLGDIPVHWALDRGKFYFREIDERSTTGDEELLSVSHITGVTPRSQKNISMFKAESYVGSKICRPGQIAINTMWAWMAAVGVSKHLGVISPSYHTYEQLDERRFNDDFLDTLLRSTPFKDMYTVHSSGITSSRLRLYPEDFLNLRFPCPPLEEQKAIVNWLDNETRTTNAAISRAEREIELMNEYRTRLISDVVTGKTDVRDVVINDDEELDDSESDALDIVDYDEGMVTLDDEESTD